MHVREQVGIDHVWRLQLLRGFVASEGLQRFIARGLVAALREQWLQRGENAALPVDQRAVAVDGEGAEIGQFHRRSFISRTIA